MKIRIAILLLLSGLIGLNTVQAQAFNDIVINQPAPHKGYSHHGYYDYRLQITNNSPNQPHQITITFLPYSYYVKSSLQQLSRSIRVPPASSVSVSLLQPALSMQTEARVTIDGRKYDQPLNISRSEHYASSYDDLLCLLLAVSQNRGHWQSQLEEAGIPLTDKSHRNKIELIKSEARLSDWSPLWLSYSRYDAIILSTAEFEQAPRPVQSALIRYLKCGGTLVAMGPPRNPALWPLPLKPASGSPSFQYHGFGVLISIPNPDINRLSKADLRDLHSEWMKTQRPFIHIPNAVQSNTSFPIIEDLTVDTKFFFVVMVIFVIVVGPVNFLIFSKNNRQMWMWLSIPLISFFTCLLIFAYATFTEGFDNYLKAYGFTLLDENTHQATTLGIDAYYSNLTPSQGAHFTIDTELTPLVSHNYRSGTPKGIDWTHDQYLAFGWLTARIPTFFLVRKDETRRERLEITYTDGRPAIVLNGLGAPIQRLILADRTGHIYQAQNIAEGVHGPLRPSAWQTTRGTVGKALRQRYLQFKPQLNFAQLKGGKNQYPYQGLLIKASYIAELQGCPFMERGLNQVDHQQLNATVFGLMVNSQ